MTIVHTIQLSKVSAVAASCLLVLSGCITEPVPPPRAGDIPSAFEQQASSNGLVWPDPSWWRGFSSTELNELVATAQKDNLNIEAATARVLQADARARLTGASLLPTVALGLDAISQTRGRADASQGCITSSSHSVGVCLSASYELDFWGRNRSLLAGANAVVKATAADRETIALTVVASVANTYFELLSVRERLGTARLNLENARSILADTRERVAAGLAGPLDLEQQEATVAGQEALVPQLEKQELEARAALALLVGRPPEGFRVAAQNLGGLGSPTVAPGLPSELLLRRPDIVAAEANLRAASANLEAARKAFLPSISLTGQGGFESAALGGITSPESALYVIGASILQTVFDGGRLTAQRDEARAMQQELLASYRGTIIGAMSDVETALGGVAFLAKQEALQTAQVAHQERAFAIASDRYRGGLDPYVNVLEAQRALYEGRNQLADVKLAHLQAVVGLFRALGGGWRDTDSTQSPELEVSAR